MERLYSFVVLILFLFEGSFCYVFFPKLPRVCGDGEICKDSELEEYLDGVSGMPTTEQELNTYCPATTKYIACGITLCTKENISTLPELMTNNYGSNLMHMMLKHQEIITEICTAGTELRKSYLSVIGCFKVFATDYQTFQKCLRDGLSLYKNYTLSIEDPSKKANIREDSRCMSEVYYYQCVGELTRDKCGKDAGDMVMNIIKKISILKLFCTEESVYNYKTKFLDFLKVNKEKRDRYTSFIDSIFARNRL